MQNKIFALLVLAISLGLVRETMAWHSNCGSDITHPDCLFPNSYFASPMISNTSTEWLTIKQANKWPSGLQNSFMQHNTTQFADNAGIVVYDEQSLARPGYDYSRCQKLEFLKFIDGTEAIATQNGLAGLEKRGLKWAVRHCCEPIDEDFIQHPDWDNRNVFDDPPLGLTTPYDQIGFCFDRYMKV